MDRAEWIWYPGDYEIYITAPLLFKRDYRGVFQSPFWRVDDCHRNVHYSRNVSLSRAERAEVCARGSVEVRISTAPNVPLFPDPDGSYTFPGGEYNISVSVYSQFALPALYVCGNELITDRNWTVSTDKVRGDYFGVGYNGFKDPRRFPGEDLFRLEEVPAVSVLSYCGNRVYDFGRELFGYVEMTDISGSGSVMLCYGESLEEACSADCCETFDRLQTDGESSLRTENARAFRYIQVIAGFSYRNLSAFHEYIPFENVPEFQCDDEVVNRIYGISLYTFHLNCREAFLDGIKRDRWYWGGDAYQSFLMNYYSYFDRDINRRTLTALAGREPYRHHVNHIPDYTFLWFIALYQHYYYIQDEYLVKMLYPSAKELMRFCLQSLSPQTGFVEKRGQDWIFIDWAAMDKRGALAAEQILLCSAMEAFARLAKTAGDDVESARHFRLAADFRRKIMDVFWDEKRSVFYHQLVDGKVSGYTAYADIFAVLFDFVGSKERKAIAKNLIGGQKKSQIVTPYAKFYQLAAYGELGEIPAMMGEIRRYWGGMVRQGATTFWELYDDAETNHYAMYGRPFGKSLCHAWGASPLYLVGRYVLGLRPAEEGYRSYRLEPCLSQFRELRARLPVRDGSIEIKFSNGVLAVTADCAIPGTLSIRARQFISGNFAKKAVRRQDDRLEIPVEPGEKLLVRYRTSEKMEELTRQ